VSDLRKQVLKLASGLPVGSPGRRKVLALLDMGMEGRQVAASDWKVLRRWRGGPYRDQPSAYQKGNKEHMVVQQDQRGEWYLGWHIGYSKHYRSLREAQKAAEERERTWMRDGMKWLAKIEKRPPRDSKGWGEVAARIQRAIDRDDYESFYGLVSRATYDFNVSYP
jgi:hypothetical protein